MKVVEVVISLKNVVLIVIAKALKTDALNRFSTVSGYFTLSFFLLLSLHFDFVGLFDYAA